MICEHNFEDIETICCKHKKCSKCGVIIKTDLCSYHKPNSEKYSGKEYFKDIEPNLFSEGIPNNMKSIKEHIPIFNKIGFHIIRNKNLIEIGSGTGRLVPLFLRLGVNYVGIETNPWACKYVANSYFVPVIERHFEDIEVDDNCFDYVVCIHTLEHLKKADFAFEKMARILKPGGIMFIEIPDDTDLYNPDHFWFFNESVLTGWAEKIGLKKIGFLKQKIVERENFLYFLFEKRKV